MRILYFITKSNRGGAQHYVYDLATNLPHGMTAEVVVGGEGQLVEELREAGITVHTLHTLKRDVRLRDEVRTFISLVRLFRRLAPDVLHLNSSKAGGLGALAGRVARVPRIVFTAHAWAFNEDRSIGARLLIRFLSWCTVLLAHQTIAVSEAVAHDVSSWPLARKRVQIIYLGCAPPRFLPRAKAREVLKRMYTLPFSPGASWLVHVAELHPSKGHFSLLAALTQTQTAYDVHVVLMGEGELRSELARHISSLGLSDKVHLLGHVPHAARYLKAFDGCLLPSRTEALGYTLIEAAYAELPIVATSVGGIPEVVRVVGGTLIPSDNVDALARALEALSRGTIAASNAAICTEHFSLSRMLEETMHIYVAGNPKQSAIVLSQRTL